MKTKKAYFKRQPTEKELRLTRQEKAELKRLADAENRPMVDREIVLPKIHRG